MPTPQSRNGSPKRWALWFIASTAIVLSAPIVFADAYTEDDTQPAAASWDVVAVSSGKSRFEDEARVTRVLLASGDWASSSKRIDFGAPERAISVTFDIRISGRVPDGVAGQVFRMGSGFSTTNNDESDANTYGRIGLIATKTESGFQLRDLGTRRTSPEFRGTQAITWALNRSGDALVYSAPDGTRESIANHRMDVWAGRVKVFDDIAVTNPKAAITDFKWFWNAGPGTATFNHLEVETLEPATAEVTAAREPVTDALAPVEGSPSAPALELYRPTPNPFAGTMRYAYAIAGGSEPVAIDVFDIGGRVVRNLVHGIQTRGQYQVVWDGLGDDGVRAKSSVYFLRAAIGAQDRVTRVVLVK